MILEDVLKNNHAVALKDEEVAQVTGGVNVLDQSTTDSQDPCGQFDPFAISGNPDDSQDPKGWIHIE